MRRLIQRVVRMWYGRGFRQEVERMETYRLYRKWYFSKVEEARNLMKTSDFSPKIRDFLIKMQG